MPVTAFSSEDDARLRDSLKRCSCATRDAACAFRRTGDAGHLFATVRGMIEHYVERGARAKLRGDCDELRLSEDLGIDSLTMLEIIFLAEDVLQVSIDNEELRPCRTVGGLKQFLAAKLLGGPPAARALAPRDAE